MQSRKLVTIFGICFLALGFGAMIFASLFMNFSEPGTGFSQAAKSDWLNNSFANSETSDSRNKFKEPAQKHRKKSRQLPKEVSSEQRVQTAKEFSALPATEEDFSYSSLKITEQIDDRLVQMLREEHLLTSRAEIDSLPSSKIGWQQKNAALENRLGTQVQHFNEVRVIKFNSLSDADEANFSE